jgi:hypothetical protein
MAGPQPSGFLLPRTLAKASASIGEQIEIVRSILRDALNHSGFAGDLDDRSLALGLIFSTRNAIHDTRSEPSQHSGVFLDRLQGQR